MASKRVRIFVWAAGLVAAAAILLTVTVAFLIFRSIVSTPAGAKTAAEAFDAIRRTFPAREPLIYMGDIKRGDFRVNRAPSSPRKDVQTLRFLLWDPEEQKLVRGEAPAWVVHLRVSPLGIGGWSFSDLHVTLEDIERYAPGIILDFKTPEGEQVLVWTH